MTTATMPTTQMRVNAQKSLFIGKKKKKLNLRPLSSASKSLLLPSVRPRRPDSTTKPINDHMYNIIILYLYICYYYYVTSLIVTSLFSLSPEVCCRYIVFFCIYLYIYIHTHTSVSYHVVPSLFVKHNTYNIIISILYVYNTI